MDGDHLMPVRYPGPPPRYSDSGILWQKLVDAMIIAPLSRLMSQIFGNDPEDWDTWEEIEDGIESWLLNIPILGDILSLFDKILRGNTSGLTGISATLAGWVGGKWSTLTNVKDVQVPRLDNRIDELSGIGTRSTFYSSGPFNDPGDGKTIAVVVFNAGSGLTGAKYVYQEFLSDDLTFPVPVTVGAPGNASSFGSYLSGSWTSGGIVTAQGILDGSRGDAGDGGLGYRPGEAGGPAEVGGGNIFAAGGAAGTATTWGQRGSDAPIDKVAMVGGGGGGGGYGGLAGVNDGGDGGWPGGGAGTGGRFSLLIGANGTPGYGGVIITVKGIA